jgi:glyoxylase-like metal-dependent hydrolase (beta-lactamase superfamily II)
MQPFQQLTPGVYVRRYPVLDVNNVLITGTERALLVDTLSTATQAAELAQAVRQVTDLPVTVVNTHGHFDHVFGNETIARSLAVQDIWAHPAVIKELSDRPGQIVAEARNACRELAPSIADEVGDITPFAPNRPVETEVRLDLGGRSVRMWHPGPAHTTADIVVLAADVLIAGDLIEEGAPPDVADADLSHWPAAIDALLPYMTGPVVPGHGAVVAAAFCARQRDELAALAGLGSDDDRENRTTGT